MHSERAPFFLKLAALGGVVFLLLGLGLILVPLVKERRNAKKKQEEAL